MSREERSVIIIETPRMRLRPLTEGGRAALDYAFTKMKVAEVVALTAASNIASQRVMQRLGMTHDAHDDFDHPHAWGTSLQRCVLYRLNVHSEAIEVATMLPRGLALPIRRVCASRKPPVVTCRQSRHIPSTTSGQGNVGGP